MSRPEWRPTWHGGIKAGASRLVESEVGHDNGVTIIIIIIITITITITNRRVGVRGGLLSSTKCILVDYFGYNRLEV